MLKSHTIQKLHYDEGLMTVSGDFVDGADAVSYTHLDVYKRQARTGRSLWQFTTGQTIHASPMSYAVDGVQYVAVAAGSDVISFSLPH